MGQLSQVPGLAGYQQQVQFNENQDAGQLMKLSQMMNMAQQAQAMQDRPEELAFRRQSRQAQSENWQAEAQERQARTKKMQEQMGLVQRIASMPPDHPERPMLIQQYKMLADPSSAFAAPQMPKMRERIEGGRTIQEEFQPDGTFKKVGEGERFAKQIPSVVQVGSDQGKAPSGYRFTRDGNMEAIPGGPADVKAQAQANLKAGGATDVDLAVSTLRDAYDRLEKGGGITSTEKSGAANIIPSLSSSGAGQMLGKMLGTANQSARNDIAMTRPALLAALMKATGMSAKQMDSNAELKLWLATATDPTLDVGSNRRALANIERKYLGAQSDQPAQPPAPASQSVQKPSMQEWMAKARAANPSASGAELEAYYFKKYGVK